MKLIKRAIGAGIGLLLVATGLVAVQSATPAAAANMAEFNSGYIISDANFYSRSAMSEGEIQAFLNARIGPCQNGQCLNVLRTDVASRGRIVSDSTGLVRCEAFPGGTGLSAAAIIYRAQVACGISAKVILVTLQKEQGLITGGNRANPSRAALDRAMGFACPDTAPCAVDSLGFGNQVYKGALQLNTYRAARFGRQPGPQAIEYKPFTNCGAPVVNVLNYATAALYNYTPYQPNAAALANQYGIGDACSSYGNRNFFVFYSDWFGSPTGPLNPVGGINTVSALRGAISVRGWTFDYSSAASIRADVYVNGAYVSTLQANQPRPDVAAIFPGRGPNSGFRGTVSTSPGVKNVCIYGINVGPGASALIGCRSVAVIGNVNPVGDINTATRTATGLNLRGWAYDADTADPIRTDVYVDGVYRATLTADRPRPDVKAAHPNQGGNHGFQASVTLPAGARQVCVYGINVGGGANAAVACRTIAPPITTPVGDINSLTGGVGVINARGWTFAPGVTNPIVADLYIDGAYSRTFAANAPRPDVQAAYPRQGGSHGFVGSAPASAGSRNACLYGINPTTGASALIGCRQVAVAG